MDAQTAPTAVPLDKLFVYGSLDNPYHVQLLIGRKLPTQKAILYGYRRIHPKSGYPFGGERFNVTMASIHADGVLKNEEIYNIFDTAKILNRPLGVLLTNRSGIAGVGFWVNEELKKRGQMPVDKRDPRVANMFEWVEAQYADGRVTAMSPEELMTQFNLHFTNVA